MVGRHRQPRHALHGAGRRHLGLAAPHVGGAEEELAVEVGDVDGVHVDHVDGAKPRQRQVLEQLAAQAPGAHHQNPGQGDAGWGGG